MQLFLRGEQSHLVELSPDWTLAALKELVLKFTGLDVSDQVLCFGGRVLDDDSRSLSDYGLLPLCSVDVSSRMLGGKVHGSLARAGKVRGQTPKVEKQEKRKKKTGRAKRRMQYNRRFVNVVTGGPGRRRGPNANV